MLTVLFALCGALGAALHALGSLVAFVGNGSFVSSWSLWYLAQPLRGAILSCGFFWLIQGGLLGGVGEAPQHGTAMMGATFLVGLFSDPAIEKLREVFLVMFRTSDTPRKNKLAARQPVVAKASFDTSVPPVLKLEGEAFAPQDKVSINGIELTVTKRDDKTLEMELPVELATSGLKLKVVVKPAHGNASAPFEVEVP